ncbi:MAG: hypothetical protein ACD_37C00359G0005 [uncultured bacterium]|nr:MAG: hypothetical protein ACD_37C00359G0005 [uncultured bacterium]
MINILASFLILVSTVLFTASSGDNPSAKPHLLQIKDVFQGAPVTYQSSFSPTPSPSQALGKNEENVNTNTGEAQNSVSESGVVVNSDSLHVVLPVTPYISNHPAPTEGGLVVPDQGSNSEQGSVEGGISDGYEMDEPNGEPIENPGNYQPLEIHGPNGIVTVSH